VFVAAVDDADVLSLVAQCRGGQSCRRCALEPESIPILRCASLYLNEQRDMA